MTRLLSLLVVVVAMISTQTLTTTHSPTQFTELCSLTNTLDDHVNIEETKTEILLDHLMIPNEGVGLNCTVNRTLLIPVVIRCNQPHITIPCYQNAYGGFGCFTIIPGSTIDITFEGCSYIRGALLKANNCSRCNITINNVYSCGNQTPFEQFSDTVLVLLVDISGVGSYVTVFNSTFVNASQALLIQFVYSARVSYVHVEYMRAMQYEASSPVELRDHRIINVNHLTVRHTKNVGDLRNAKGGCFGLSGPNVTVRNSYFSNCYCLTGNGGCAGISLFNNGVVLFENLTMDTCDSRYAGGALIVYFHKNGTMIIRGMRLTNLKAFRGSALAFSFLMDAQRNRVTLSDVVASGAVGEVSRGCFLIQRQCLSEVCGGALSNVVKLENVLFSNCNDDHQDGKRKNISSYYFSYYRQVISSDTRDASYETDLYSRTRSATATQTITKTFEITNQVNTTKSGSTMTTKTNDRRSGGSGAGSIVPAKVMTIIQYGFYGEQGTGGIAQSTASLALLVAQTSRRCDDLVKDNDDEEDGDDFGYIGLCISSVEGGDRDGEKKSCDDKGSLGRKAGVIVFGCVATVVLPIVMVLWTFHKSIQLSVSCQPSKCMWWVTYWGDITMVAASHMAQRNAGDATASSMIVVLIGCGIVGPLGTYVMHFGASCLTAEWLRNGLKWPQNGFNPYNDIALSLCGSLYDVHKVKTHRIQSVWTLVFSSASHIILSFVTTAPMYGSSSKCHTHGIVVAVIHGLLCVLYCFCAPFVYLWDNVVSSVCSGLSSVAVVVSLSGNPDVGLAIVAFQAAIRLVYATWKRGLWIKKRCSKKK
eukprot:PhF_6_TR575/c0_g1_i1/m.596